MIEYPALQSCAVETKVEILARHQGNTPAHEHTQPGKWESCSGIFVRRFLKRLVKSV